MTGYIEQTGCVPDSLGMHRPQSQKPIAFEAVKLNQFHGFSISKPLLEQTGEIGFSKFSQEVLFNICSYLMPKDIYNMIITGKGWSVDFLSQIRNLHILITNQEQRKALMSVLKEVKGQPLLIRSVSIRCDMSRTKLDNVLCKLPKLKRLSIRCSQMMTIDYLKSVGRRFVFQIEEIPKDPQKRMSAEMIPNLLLAVPDITKLVVNHGNYHDAHFSVLVKGSLPALRIVDMRDFSIGATNFMLLMEAAPYITKLNLSGKHDMPRPELKMFGDLSLPALEELNFSGTKITIDDIASVLKAAPNLKRLNVSNVRTLFEADFLKLAPELLQSLEIIHLFNTKIGLEDVQYLKDHMPHFIGLTLPLKMEKVLS